MKEDAFHVSYVKLFLVDQFPEVTAFNKVEDENTIHTLIGLVEEELEESYGIGLLLKDRCLARLCLPTRS